MEHKNSKTYIESNDELKEYYAEVINLLKKEIEEIKQEYIRLDKPEWVNKPLYIKQRELFIDSINKQYIKFIPQKQTKEK